MPKAWYGVAALVRDHKQWTYFLVSFGLLAATAAYVAQQAGSGGFLAGSRFGTSSLAIVAAASVLSMLLGAIRLRSLAYALGHPLQFAICVRTVTLSQAAANFFFQVYGQLASRAFLLQRQGVPAATTVLMTLVERFVGLVFLLVLAGAGAMVVFGAVQIDMTAGGIDLLRILCGLALAFGAVTVVSLRVDRYREHLLHVDGVVLAKSLLRVSLLTVAIQCATLVAFTSAALALAPETDLLKLVAASAIVMLASALPISFGGWGVREFSAVFALGAVGVPVDAAFISAFVVGMTSLVVALGVGSASFLARSTKTLAVQRRQPHFDALSALAWGLPLLTGVLIFFQLYLPMANGKVNVSLSDPIVLIGGSLFFLCLPRGGIDWQVPRLSVLVISCTVVVLAGLVHGWLAFGSNAWAVTKAFGWFVLLGYALTAALIVRVGGEEGRQVIFRTLVVAFLAVACLQYMIYLGQLLGLSLRGERSAGFAQDPNAFAFQCLVVMALILALFAASRFTAVALGACFFMLWLSASRSGWIAAVALIAVALYFRPRSILVIAAGTVLALLAGIVPLVLKLTAGSLLFGSDAVGVSVIETVSYRTASDVERWGTLRDAFWLFVDRPVFGQGLGYFVEHYTRLDGSRLIVHSSYLWLLAEFGVLGAFTFLLAALCVVLREWPRALDEPVSRAVILLLIGFGTMVLVHDLTYQRLLWFVLGAAFACSPTTQSSSRRLAGDEKAISVDQARN